MNDTDEKLLTAREVAQALRVSPRTVRNWRTSRTGPRELDFVKVGGHWRVRAASLEAVLHGEGDTHEHHTDAGAPAV